MILCVLLIYATSHDQNGNGLGFWLNAPFPKDIICSALFRLNHAHAAAANTKSQSFINFWVRVQLSCIECHIHFSNTKLKQNFFYDSHPIFFLPRLLALHTFSNFEFTPDLAIEFSPFRFFYGTKMSFRCASQLENLELGC